MNLQEQVNEVIAFSQNSPIPGEKFNSTELLNRWRAAKQPFIDKMGGRYIYTSPEKLHFSIDGEAKERLFDSFLEVAPTQIYDFLEHQGSEAFYENRVKKKYVYWADGDEQSIPAGMKLIKAFKYFYDSSENSELRELQDKASMLIQETKIEGYLSVSCHPLDYLSISENNNSWRSCHALDGEWRGGNLSYMVDPSTLVCYLTSSPPNQEHVSIPRFGQVQWNNKKWRVLLYFSPDNDIIYTGRSYPFDNSEILNYILDTLLAEAGLIPSYHTFCPWTQDYTNLIGESIGNYTIPRDATARLYPLGTRNAPLIGMKKAIKEYPNFLGFNDLFRSHFYIPRYTVMMNKNNAYYFPAHRTKTQIGDYVPCPCCGELEVTDSSSLFCNRCKVQLFDEASDDWGRCSCCGQILPMEELVNASGYDGIELFCEDCAKTKAKACKKCGEVYRDYIIDENNGLCPWCAIEKRDSERRDHFGF